MEETNKSKRTIPLPSGQQFLFDIQVAKAISVLASSTKVVFSAELRTEIKKTVQFQFIKQYCQETL